MKMKKAVILFFLSMLVASVFAEEIVLSNAQEFKIRGKSLVGKQVCIEADYIGSFEEEDGLRLLFLEFWGLVPEKNLTEPLIKKLIKLEVSEHVRIHGIVVKESDYTSCMIEISELEILPKR